MLQSYYANFLKRLSWIPHWFKPYTQRFIGMYIIKDVKSKFWSMPKFIIKNKTRFLYSMNTIKFFALEISRP